MTRSQLSADRHPLGTLDDLMPTHATCPKPDEPEPIGLVYATWLNLSSDGGRYEPVSDGTLRRPDRRCAVLLRPCGDHRHGAGDLLRRGDDAVSVCQGYPHFRLPSLCPQRSRERTHFCS